ncbi:MAG TPA: hypothetical protein PLB55_21755 [Prosthecobacter sp.]|nr:hypothetical protein [Prosthecobacter sp.]
MGTLSLKARVNLECIDKLDAADAEANDAAKIVKFIEACTPELNEKVCKVAGSSVDNDCYGKAEAIKVAAFTVAEVEQVQKACAQRTALCQ